TPARPSGRASPRPAEKSTRAASFPAVPRSSRRCTAAGSPTTTSPPRTRRRGMQTGRTELSTSELPPGGAAIVVAPAPAGTAPAERYRRASSAGSPLPAGTPLVALVRSGALSTPDTVEVRESSRDGDTFRLTLDVRRYTGPISANVEREVLVEADLGSLPAGQYAVVVTTTTVEFQDQQHPDRSGNLSTADGRLEFDVR